MFFKLFLYILVLLLDSIKYIKDSYIYSYIYGSSGC